ncbi:MAG: hypothetical protein KJZ78_19520 [Bryobacteraceae bacterium]|nr:hypothetical protein [Bryobacteraceae bacterium]
MTAKTTDERPAPAARLRSILKDFASLPEDVRRRHFMAYMRSVARGQGIGALDPLWGLDVKPPADKAEADAEKP